MSEWPRAKSGVSVNPIAPGLDPALRIPFGWVEPLVFVTDSIIIVGASLASGIAYHQLVGGNNGDIEIFFAIGLLIAIIVTTILASRGSCNPVNLVTFPNRAKELAVIWLIAFSSLLGVVFLLKVGSALSRGSVAAFAFSGLLLLLGWRAFLSSYLAKAFARGAFADRPVLVIGEPDQIDSSESLRNLRLCGYRPVWKFSVSRSDIAADTGPSPDLRTVLDRAIHAARSGKVEEILLAIPWNQSRLIETIVDALRVVPISVRLVPDRALARMFSKPRSRIGTTWVVDLCREPLTLGEYAAKRALDIVCASFALVALAPLMAITAILIKLDSPGPVFFLQIRNGFNNKEFRIFKFRTLTVLEQGSDVKQVTRDDKRLTRVGRWLRQSSIDELPQFLNVLRGEMSLVGPRPHAATHNNEYQKLIADYAFRHHVKPGITGWAQINGLRGETPTIELMQQRVELDLWYINNWSMWLDFKILLKTFSAVISQDTAY
jgi:Undecaprenyl-phosphate glucose phosphotransferase